MDKRIATIINNQPLATAIQMSLSSALQSPFVNLVDNNSVWKIFKHSLDAAIRDIEEHSRGKLFRRLIEYGPLNPDDPETVFSDNGKNLSDPECGSCVEFIFSHMVNRFKGELAELLALEPCIKLINQLIHDGKLPTNIELYWGETIQERRNIGVSYKKDVVKWGNFTKGADGILSEKISEYKNKSLDTIKIRGIVEVKSMSISSNKVLYQINKHFIRLNGGVKLMEREWPATDQLFVPLETNDKSAPSVFRVMVIPSTWKLSREWKSVKTDKARIIEFPAPSEPPVQTKFEEIKPNFWRITLAWSEEILSQAAYEMTFWYMSQVGEYIYTKKTLPKEWQYMTPSQAGYNAIKMMLYYIPLRYISRRQVRLATRLYNVYSFGYPLGVDSKVMLWPEDFPG